MNTPHWGQAGGPQPDALSLHQQFFLQGQKGNQMHWQHLLPLQSQVLCCLHSFSFYFSPPNTSPSGELIGGGKHRKIVTLHSNLS